MIAREEEAHLASPSARTNISYRDGAFMVGAGGSFYTFKGGRGTRIQGDSRKLLRVQKQGVSVLRARVNGISRGRAWDQIIAHGVSSTTEPPLKGEAQFQGIDRLIDMYDVVFIVSQSRGWGKAGLPRSA